MSDASDESESLEQAVRQFLHDADTAFQEYDRGYTDADATLRLLRSHLDQLEESVE